MTSAVDMSGVWARFDLACEHLGTFQGTLGAWLSSNGPTLTQQIEPDRRHVYRWSVRREPDITEFAVVAADMFHNLRAALDYLVYQLVIANGKVPRPRQNSFGCGSSNQALRGCFAHVRFGAGSSGCRRLRGPRFVLGRGRGGGTGSTRVGNSPHLTGDPVGLLPGAGGDRSQDHCQHQPG